VISSYFLTIVLSDKRNFSLYDKKRSSDLLNNPSFFFVQQHGALALSTAGDIAVSNCAENGGFVLSTECETPLGG
jgi:hypothetical protein